MLTKELLLDLFTYDREQGTLTWKNHWSNNRKLFIGKPVGRTTRQGYLETKIKGVHYRVHQLIWMLEFGEFVTLIDHINGVRSDNRISNLRSTTHKENSLNRYIHRAGRLPYCYFEKDSGLWKAQIYLNGKPKNLGRFNTELEAHTRSLKELQRV